MKHFGSSGHHLNYSQRIPFRCRSRLYNINDSYGATAILSPTVRPSPFVLPTFVVIPFSLVVLVGLLIPSFLVSRRSTSIPVRNSPPTSDASHETTPKSHNTRTTFAGNNRTEKCVFRVPDPGLSNCAFTSVVGVLRSPSQRLALKGKLPTPDGFPPDFRDISPRRF